MTWTTGRTPTRTTRTAKPQPARFRSHAPH
jgi:hypothetical protein